MNIELARSRQVGWRHLQPGDSGVRGADARAGLRLREGAVPRQEPHRRAGIHPGQEQVSKVIRSMKKISLTFLI